MQAFTDNEGRTWTVHVTPNTLKRVKARLDVELLDVVCGDLLERLLRDPLLLADVLYAICEPEVTAQGLRDEQFWEALTGDVVEAATRAVLEGVADFFPSPDRANIRQVIRAAFQAKDHARALVSKRIADGALERARDHALEASGNSSTSAPGSSASTPAT